MNIITKSNAARLAVYGFYKDNGGLPAALEMYTALLAAHYHPSLTAATSVNGIYSLTLVELPCNEVDTFRTQQLGDEQSWGKPLSYFDFAKLNPGVSIEITADDFSYMLGVLPPIHGKRCFAMGELYTHNPAGEPVYYWASKRGRRYFCLLGTQQEAEQEFAPSSPALPAPKRETSNGPPQLCPPIVWTKPLTACGPEQDPNVKLHGMVEIDGVSFHAEAFEVSYSSDGEQIGKQDEEETHLGEICNIVQGAADTLQIAGREYVLSIIPAQR